MPGAEQLVGVEAVAVVGRRHWRRTGAASTAAAAAPSDVAALALKAHSGERPLPSTASCVASYGQWCSASPTAAAATIRRA